MGAKAESKVSPFISGRSLVWGLSLAVLVSSLAIESLVRHSFSIAALFIPIVLSALGVALAGIWAVPFLRSLKTGQFIREEGPSAHQAKAGTPTMGGLFFIPIAVLVAIAYSSFSSGSSEVLGVAALTLAYGGIGWLDDWQVIRRRSNKGISPQMKLALQVGVSCLFCGWLFFLAPETITSIQFPFGWILPLGVLFWPLAVFTPVAQSNATNLTDGLDGLAAGTGAIAFLGLGILNLQESPSLTAFCASLAGGCLGFLAHNRNPASVFMGDTGSLALGGAMAGVALVSNHLFGLLILSGVFLVETLSVIAQVAYYKATKDENGIGKRLLKMAPFHHHLELSGWSEIDVVTFLYGVGIVLAIVAIALSPSGF